MRLKVPRTVILRCSFLLWSALSRWRLVKFVPVTGSLSSFCHHETAFITFFLWHPKLLVVLTDDSISTGKWGSCWELLPSWRATIINPVETSTVREALNQLGRTRRAHADIDPRWHRASLAAITPEDAGTQTHPVMLNWSFKSPVLHLHGLLHASVFWLHLHITLQFCSNGLLLYLAFD